MATLTIVHTGGPRGASEIAALCASNGADATSIDDVDATVQATFAGEPEARTVASTLAHAATVTDIGLS